MKTSRPIHRGSVPSVRVRGPRWRLPVEIRVDVEPWPWTGPGFATEGVDYDLIAPTTLTFQPG